MVVVAFVAGCGGETPVEQAEEEAGVEEVEKAPPRDAEEAAADEAKKKAAEAGAKATPFEGEHENLGDGDTAIWNDGLSITISDIHVAPNEARRQAEERKAKADAKGKEGKGEPKGMPERALEGPENLIAFSWTVTNDGEMPIRFNGALPCEGLDENGLPLSRAEGSTAEELDVPPTRNVLNTLEQPLEQGQTRSGLASIPVPDSGTAEFICVHPPQQGGEPSIAQIPEQGRATWTLDPADLESRG